MEKFNKENKYLESIIKINSMIILPIFLMTIFSAIYVKYCSQTSISCSFEYFINILYHGGAAMTISAFIYLLWGYTLQYNFISSKYKILIDLLSIVFIYILLLMAVFPSEFTSENKNNKFDILNTKHYIKVSNDLKNYIGNKKINTNLGETKDNMKEYKKNIKDTVWDMLGITIIFFINILPFLFYLTHEKTSFNKENKNIE